MSHLYLTYRAMSWKECLSKFIPSSRTPVTQMRIHPPPKPHLRICKRIRPNPAKNIKRALSRHLLGQSTRGIMTTGARETTRTTKSLKDIYIHRPQKKEREAAKGIIRRFVFIGAILYFVGAACVSTYLSLFWKRDSSGIVSNPS